MSRDDRRRDVLTRIATYLLAEGLAGASLRPMAAASGTSDRMLLYYFTDREDLLSAALGHIADELATLLAAPTEASGRMPFDRLLAEVWPALRGSQLKPYMQLWLEIAARGARGEEPYHRIGGRIADTFLAWAGDRLLVEDEEDRATQAALLLATVDGLAILDGLGRGEAANAAAGVK